MEMSPYQFNLRAVFVVTTLAAIVLGICHYLTPIGLTKLAFWVLLPGLAFTFFIVCVQLGSLSRSLFRRLRR